MSYKKQTHKNGTVLRAEQLNHMEEGIAQIDSKLEKAVLFSEQKLTDEQKAQARKNIGAVSVDDIGEVTILSSADFINGLPTVGQGIVTSDYWITLTNPVPVKIGDKIDIKPNGATVLFQIESIDNFADVVMHLKQLSITTDTVYVSEYDGYCFISVKSPAGQKTTPESYSCDISVGASRITVLEEQLVETNEKMDTLQKSIPVVHYASHKHKPFTRIVNDCQDASRWVITNNDGTLVSVDTANFILGTQSLCSDKQMRCTKDIYDMVNNDIVVNFRINSIADNAKLYLTVSHKSDPSKTVRYCIARGSSWTTPTDWQEIAIPYTGWSYGSTDGFDFSNVDDIYFITGDGAVDWNLQYVGLRPKVRKKGIVTFTFDDGYKSQYTGIKVLAEKGITGTIFHIIPANNSGLSVSELQELVNHYGTNIEVHGDPAFITDTVPESERGGFSADWTEESLKAYWEEIQNFIKTNGLGEGKHMAYPNGMFPDRIVQLARSYFDSCRTIKPFIPLETYPPADRYRIRAVSGVGAGGTTVDKVKDYIDRAVASGDWLILVFHKIGTDGTDSMWCTEDDLKAIADYAIASGAYIMNYAEVFDSGVVL